MPAQPCKHPLLIYRQLFCAWRLPALLIALGTGSLWWLAPPLVNTPLIRAALLTACGAATLLFLYAVVGPSLCYVRCLPNNLLLSTPLFRLAVSYSRLYLTRPVRFETHDAPPSRQWLGQPYVGCTALAVDLTSFPVDRHRLRQWLNELVLPETGKGLLLLTPDWLALSRDIEACRSEWRLQRLEVVRGWHPLTSLSVQQY